MADVLGISESNVGVKLNRAKKSLTVLMKDQAQKQAYPLASGQSHDS
jgi:DNA-directed RNA polymerase specialized sigma24 family protein